MSLTLKVVLHRGLRCKEALLREQASLNAAAQHTSAAGMLADTVSPRYYEWVGANLEALNRAIVVAVDALGSFAAKVCHATSLTTDAARDCGGARAGVHGVCRGTRGAALFAVRPITFTTHPTPHTFNDTTPLPSR